MFPTLILGLVLLGQKQPSRYPVHHPLVMQGQIQPYQDWFPDRVPDRDADFGQPPVTLHRYMPLEAIDLEVQRQQSVVRYKQRVYDATRRQASRGAISRWELEQAAAELRFHEAQEAERAAYRNLEVYERDTRGGVIAPDDAKVYSLLRDWLKWRGAMAEAKAELRASRLAHDQELHRRNHIRYWDWVESRLEVDAARAEVALCRAQQDWAALGQAARIGPGAGDPQRHFRCKRALRQAGVRCSEARVARDDLLLGMIRVVLRSRLPLMSATPRSLVLLLQVAHDDALASLAAERRRLAEVDIEKADPENYALALRRSIELDDLDRAIRHQHHEVLLWKAHLDHAQQLARRAAISPAELEWALAHVRFLEALEAERIACRALIAYDRDTRGWALPPDGLKEYTLLLDWLKRKEDMAQVEAGYLASRLVQDRKLFECRAMSPANWVLSCRDREAARAEVALYQAEQARFSWKLAVLTGQAAVDPAELLRLRIAGFRASVRYHEATTARFQVRLEKAEQLLRKDFITGIEFNRCQRAYDSAGSALAVHRQRCDRLETHREHDPSFAQELEELAEFLRLRWDFERARLLYEQTLTLRKAVHGENHPETARTLSDLAGVYGAMGDLVRAEPLLRQALEINQRAVGEEHPFSAASLSRLAALYGVMGDTAQAKVLLLQELGICKKVYGDKHPSYARSLDNLVMLYCALGDYGRAELLAYQAAETLKTAVGEAHPYSAMGRNRLAWVRTLKGDYDGAEHLVRQALAVQEAVPGNEPLSYAESLHILARVYQGKGDTPRAESLYHQVLAIEERVLGEAHPDCSIVLRDLARLYHSMGDSVRAESVVLRALGIDRQSVELTSAVQSERQQLIMIGKLRSGLDLYLSMAPRAHCECAGVYREVLAWKGTVFARQQQMRLARTRTDPDPEVARLCTELDQVTRRLASRVFGTETLQPDPSGKQQIQELTEEKERRERELSRRSAAFDSHRQLSRLAPARVQAALPPATALIDILEYTHVTPPCQGKGKMAGERRVLAFVVRPDRPIVRVDLGPAAAITTAVDRWRAAFVDDRPAPRISSADPAVELHRLVWQPLERSLQGARAVLVSPDGALARFPLAALPGRSPGSFLIEELPIALVPVPQLLAASARASDRPGSPPSLLLVGDIDFCGLPRTPGPAGAGLAGHLASRGGRLMQFPSLPGTTRELTAVRTTFQGTNPAGVVDEVRGAAATEAAVRSQAPGKRYLHLATHSFFAPPELRSALNRPALMVETPGGPELAPGRAGRFSSRDTIMGFHPGLLSGLALAGANGNPDRAAENRPLDDGILTAMEVAELDLRHTDLVVLSACETGLGRAAGGEGLLGLQRAFQVAGARTVVASLWKVDDQATQQLMADFYDQLWQRHLTPIEALRQAQLHVLNGCVVTGPARGVGAPEPEPAGSNRARAHPRLWAAWVVSGDPEMR